MRSLVSSKWQSVKLVLAMVISFSSAMPIAAANALRAPGTHHSLAQNPALAQLDISQQQWMQLTLIERALGQSLLSEQTLTSTALTQQNRTYVVTPDVLEQNPHIFAVYYWGYLVPLTVQMNEGRTGEDLLSVEAVARTAGIQFVWHDPSGVSLARRNQLIAAANQRFGAAFDATWIQPFANEVVRGDSVGDRWIPPVDENAPQGTLTNGLRILLHRSGEPVTINGLVNSFHENGEPTADAYQLPADLNRTDGTSSSTFQREMLGLTELGLAQRSRNSDNAYEYILAPWLQALVNHFSDKEFTQDFVVHLFGDLAISGLDVISTEHAQSLKAEVANQIQEIVNSLIVIAQEEQQGYGQAIEILKWMAEAEVIPVISEELVAVANAFMDAQLPPVNRPDAQISTYQDMNVMNIYLQHFLNLVRDFGLIGAIQYMRQSGFTTIWFNPFMETPPAPHDDGGYAKSDYRRFNQQVLDQAQGLIEAEQAKSLPDPFIQALDATNPEDQATYLEHVFNVLGENNIGIVVDLILNHTSWRHEWYLASANPLHPEFSQYRDYYIWNDHPYKLQAGFGLAQIDYAAQALFTEHLSALEAAGILKKNEFLPKTHLVWFAPKDNQRGFAELVAQLRLEPETVRTLIGKYIESRRTQVWPSAEALVSAVHEKDQQRIINMLVDRGLATLEDGRVVMGAQHQGFAELFVEATDLDLALVPELTAAWQATRYNTATFFSFAEWSNWSMHQLRWSYLNIWYRYLVLDKEAQSRPKYNQELIAAQNAIKLHLEHEIRGRLSVRGDWLGTIEQDEAVRAQVDAHMQNLVDTEWGGFTVGDFDTSGDEAELAFSTDKVYTEAAETEVMAELIAQIDVGAYNPLNVLYWKRFFRYQPDLNLLDAIDPTQLNEAVLNEFIDIAVFWIEKNAAGFRLDAIKHLVEEEFVTADNHDLTFQFVQRFLEGVQIKLVENGMPEEEAAQIFAWHEVVDGNTVVEAYVNLSEASLGYNFRVMTALWSQVTAVNAIQRGNQQVPMQLLEHFSRAFNESPDVVLAALLSGHDQFFMPNDALIGPFMTRQLGRTVQISDGQGGLIGEFSTQESATSNNLVDTAFGLAFAIANGPNALLSEATADQLNKAYQTLAVLMAVIAANDGPIQMYYHMPSADDVDTDYYRRMYEQQGITPEQAAGWLNTQDRRQLKREALNPQRVLAGMLNADSPMHAMAQLQRIRHNHPGLTRGAMRLIPTGNPAVLAFVQEWENPETGKTERYLKWHNIGGDPAVVELNLEDLGLPVGYRFELLTQAGQQERSMVQENGKVVVVLNGYSYQWAEMTEDAPLNITSGRTVQDKHTYFAALQAEALDLGNPISFALTIEQGDGKIVQEVVTLPMTILAEEYDNLTDYLAYRVHARGLIQGAKRVGLSIQGPEGLQFLDDTSQNLLAAVEKTVAESYGKTDQFANFGQPVRYQLGALSAKPVTESDITLKDLNIEVQVGEAPAFAGAIGSAYIALNLAGLSVDEGTAVGVDIGGTNIKLVVLERGQVVYEQAFPLDDMNMPIGAFLKQQVDALREAYRVDAETFADHVVVTIPGPVTPDGDIVFITNIENAYPGSKKSLEQDFQALAESAEYAVRFQNDANVAAAYQAAELGLQNKRVIFNTLGTGLGLAVMQFFEFLKGTMEAHLKFLWNEKATPFHAGFHMFADLEGFANAEFVVRKATELADAQGVLETIDQEALEPRIVSEWLSGSDEALAGIAQQVFLEFGQNLAVLYGEIGRVVGETDWTVVYTGGISQGSEAMALIQEGIQQAIDEALLAAQSEPAFPHVASNQQDTQDDLPVVVWLGNGSAADSDIALSSSDTERHVAAHLGDAATVEGLMQLFETTAELDEMDDIFEIAANDASDNLDQIMKSILTNSDDA